MMKKLLAGVLAGMMLLGSCALAKTAEERMEHLFSHGEDAVFFCTGRLVKLRVAPNANKMHGRTVFGEEFIIIDSFGEWLRVEMTKVNPDNEDARRGMTGWVHVDHIGCACDLEAEQESEGALEKE